VFFAPVVGALGMRFDLNRASIDLGPPTCGHCPSPSDGVARLCAPHAGVAVAQVQPERAVIAQHAADLAEHVDQLRHEGVRRILQPDLAVELP
jgi:hypothetical protein